VVFKYESKVVFTNTYTYTRGGGLWDAWQFSTQSAS